MSELKEKVEALFAKHFNKKFAELNSTIYLATQEDDGSFSKPKIEIRGAGGTLLPHDNKFAQLNPPAKVTLTWCKFKPTILVYRVAIPVEELVIAVGNEDYFKYLMSRIVDIALSNWRATVGSENEVRFGRVYCEPSFVQTDGTDGLEMQFVGAWASEEEA